MIKYVTYKGNVYTIKHEYLEFKDTQPYILHRLYIVEVNKIDFKNNRLLYPTISWYETCGDDDQNIIRKTQELIKFYLKGQPKRTLSHEKEFEQWNGNLDNWDE